MKKINNPFLKSAKAMILVLALVCTTSLMAQPGFDDNVEDNNSVPIDGGLAVLIIGGAAAIGLKKFRDSKK
jgi:hypothetical protein